MSSATTTHAEPAAAEVNLNYAAALHRKDNNSVQCYYDTRELPLVR